MRAIIQRVRHACVTINHKVYGEIQQGFLIFVGICENDNRTTIAKVAKKCAQMRIFEDENEKMNYSLEDIKGSILSISQFTLYADCKKGRRPSFDKAAQPEISKPLYDAFNEELRNYGIHVETGIFGADMKIDLCNDGPVTIILDSEDL